MKTSNVCIVLIVLSWITEYFCSKDVAWSILQIALSLAVIIDIIAWKKGKTKNEQ